MCHQAPTGLSCSFKASAPCPAPILGPPQCQLPTPKSLRSVTSLTVSLTPRSAMGLMDLSSRCFLHPCLRLHLHSSATRSQPSPHPTWDPGHMDTWSLPFSSLPFHLTDHRCIHIPQAPLWGAGAVPQVLTLPWFLISSVKVSNSWSPGNVHPPSQEAPGPEPGLCSVFLGNMPLTQGVPAEHLWWPGPDVPPSLSPPGLSVKNVLSPSPC